MWKCDYKLLKARKRIIVGITFNYNIIYRILSNAKLVIPAYKNISDLIAKYLTMTRHFSRRDIIAKSQKRFYKNALIIMK